MGSTAPSLLWVSALIVVLLSLLVLAQSETAAESSEAVQSSLVVANVEAQNHGQNRGAYNRQRGLGLRQSDCPGACSYRCSGTSKRKACMFFCNKCCLKCLCVPPGTYGNKEVCPCYNDWKTQQGGPKCP